MSEETNAVPAQTWRPPPRGLPAAALTVVMALVAVFAALTAFRIGPLAAAGEVTDNAYVRGRTTVIAPQVSGYVVEVAVRDYARLRRSDVLIRIDDRIYRARVAQAQASLDAALAALANSVQAHASREAGVRGQAAALVSARAQLVRARADMSRVDDLVANGSVSMREQDQVRAALALSIAQLRQAESARDIAGEDVRTVEVGRNGLRAQVEAARAQLRLAQIDLSNTVIAAPEAGQLGEVGVRLGQYVTNGTQLMSLVPEGRWVIANFKEAQTHGMRSGDLANVSVDALGGQSFRGRVEEISPAAGSEFAVIRQDNGTGNFVKIPQRIGVRILLDDHQPGLSGIRPGMSVEATVVRGANA